MQTIDRIYFKPMRDQNSVLYDKTGQYIIWYHGAVLEGGYKAFKYFCMKTSNLCSYKLF